MGGEGVLIVWVSFPGLEVARRVALRVVEERLAACVKVLPGVESVYRWDGRIERGEEVVVVMKTAGVGWDALRSRIVELHPYDVPEVLSWPVGDGLPEYLRWVIGETGLGFEG